MDTLLNVISVDEPLIDRRALVEMTMQARDFCEKALFHPERNAVFVGHDGVPPFDVDADGSSSYGNAWWLSNVSHLGLVGTP